MTVHARDAKAFINVLLDTRRVPVFNAVALVAFAAQPAPLA
jgi:hypothetical protein